MTHIRFLTPFVFCLCAFLVSLVIVYYLNAELDRIEEETAQVSEHLSAESDRRDDLAEHTEALIMEAVSRSDPVIEDEMPSLGGSFVENMRTLTSYLGRLEERYRRIATAKAQHPVLLLGSAPMPLDEQLDEARQEISVLNDVAPSNVNTYIREIEQQIGVIERLSPEERRSLEGIKQISDAFREAADQCEQMLDELSFERVGDRFQLLALTSSSPAARAASRLQALLVPNSREGMSRETLENMDREDDGSLLFDGHETIDRPFRVLAADIAHEEFRYPLDPSYAAGATVEDVVYYQDLLIDMLDQVNQSLADQLAVTLAVRHQRMHDEFKDRAMGAIRAQEAQRTSDLENKAADFTRLEREAGSAVSRLESARSDLELIKDRMDTPFSEMARNFERLVNQLEQDLMRMEDEFVRLRTEGMPRPATALSHTEPDGRIVMIDEASRYYTINLGSADDIRRGTRFVILGDRDGTQYEKGVLEVVDIVNQNYAKCRLIQRLDDSEPIYEQDPIFNRFYHNGRFLRVALVGEFRPEVSPYTQERLARFLEEMGCDVQEEADVNTDVVLLAESRDQLLPVLPEIRRYLELTEMISLDEVMVADVLPYFADR